jgi:hypothetical protein
LPLLRGSLLRTVGVMESGGRSAGVTLLAFVLTVMARRWRGSAYRRKCSARKASTAW